MKNEIKEMILNNSELLEVYEVENDLVIMSLDLDAYDEETESFYRVVDYKGIQKVGHLLAEKCNEFYPMELSGVEFEFDNFNVKFGQCTVRDIF